MIVAKPLFDSASIREAFWSGGPAAECLAARSSAVEAVVSNAWRDWLDPAFPSGLAVLAVGGFGRRELFPFSDVDVLLLVEQPIAGDEHRNALSGFLRTLWDANLRLSHSVRTVNECCELDERDIERSISLIDQTFLAGDWALYSKLSDRLPRLFRGQRSSLIRHLCGLARSRHARFQGTIYHLEPNIKETPGGMRDLHLIHWLERLRSAEEDLEELIPARDFLWDLRCKLHYKAGRDQNVLTFHTQEELWQNPALEMRQYYRHARIIHREALRQIDAAEAAGDTSLLSQFRDWRARVSTSEFSVSKERVFLRMPHQMEKDPDTGLRFFEFIARHGFSSSVDAERRIIATLPVIHEYYGQPRPAWRILREILSLPHAAAALRGMHDSGFLGALFPEWKTVESLVVRDFYHRYTVDEHTLIALGKLDELRNSADASRRRFSNLFNETEGLDLLRVALLLHDIGKGRDGAAHAQTSVTMAREALERIGMPGAERNAVLFLIEHHLDLSSVMNSRDLDDPRTARELSQRVGTVERLRQLTLMTYADISAVNPGAMTPWRLEQLWRVYLAGHHELTRELETARIHLEAGGDPERAGFLEGFPVRYLRTHDESEVKRHVELARQAQSAGGVAVDLVRDAGVWRATVVSHDKPGLFASLAGALSGFGMDILKAEAFANEQGAVLDTFVFADPLRNLELNPPEVDRLKLTLSRAALGKEDVKRLLKSRPPPSIPTRTSIQPAIAFDSQASDAATLVEVVAEDRPGLLYDLARTFSLAGCSIEVVLIDTEAHKALDVFYVTANGEKLTPEMEARLKSQLTMVAGPARAAG